MFDIPAIPHAVDLSVRPEVTALFDEATSTASYVVKDPHSAACAIIDSVMDFDYAAGRTGPAALCDAGPCPS